MFSPGFTNEVYSHRIFYVCNRLCSAMQRIIPVSERYALSYRLQTETFINFNCAYNLTDMQSPRHSQKYLSTHYFTDHAGVELLLASFSFFTHFLMHRCVVSFICILSISKLVMVNGENTLRVFMSIAGQQRASSFQLAPHGLYV